jgi:hypothetical protein
MTNESKFEIAKLDKPLLEYLNEKRKPFRKISQRLLEVMTTINMLEKGEVAKVPVNSERDVSNLRTWISQNRKNLKPEVGHITTFYKKEENLLYVCREDKIKSRQRIEKIAENMNMINK